MLSQLFASDSKDSQVRPKIGVGVLVIREGKVLLGKRMGAHGANTWGPPGGHLEFQEDPVTCAIRELEEETGLKVAKIFRGPWTNDLFPSENKHYVSLFMIATDFLGEAQVMEKDKCLEWRWFDLDDLPYPLFIPLKNLEKPLRDIVSEYTQEKHLEFVSEQILN